MRKIALLAGASLLLVAALALAADAPKDWSMKATIIEACSCPMFCQCYFNAEPASHGAPATGEHAGHAGHGGGEHFCKFNNAFKVEKGSVGNVKLDGALFWVAGDLGAEFTDGEMEWAVLTFDPSVTKEQREGIQTILGSVYPVKWKSFRTEEATIDKWQFDKDGAHALLDGGRIAEVKLRGFKGMADQPVVIRNLRYWGAPRNDGFIMMPNDVEAYRVGPNAFEFKGTNGFMITVDLNSKDFPS